MHGMRPRLAGVLGTVALLVTARGGAGAAGRPIDAPPGRSAPAQVVERRVLDLLNSDRAANGLEPLFFSTRLAAVARAHSRDMARRHYVAHVSPDGRSPFDRISAAGIVYHRAGENLGRALGYAPLPAAQVLNDRMMAEPPGQENHRAIILNGALHHVGVGVVITPGGALYLTEDFTD